VRKLTGQVEELRRAAKRQATPFSKHPTPSQAAGAQARRRLRSDRPPAGCPAGGRVIVVGCRRPRSTVVARYEAQIRQLPGLPGLEPRIRV
jgi:hypothetical protein